MVRTRRRLSGSKRSLSTRTNIHINPELVRRIATKTDLKGQRAVVDYALRTTIDLLDKREKIHAGADAAYGITRSTGIFPEGYADLVRGRN